jgi:hypothetical protein
MSARQRAGTEVPSPRRRGGNPLVRSPVGIRNCLAAAKSLGNPFARELELASQLRIGKRWKKWMAECMRSDLPSTLHEQLQSVPVERPHFWRVFGGEHGIEPGGDPGPTRLTGLHETLHNEDCRGEADLVEDRLGTKHRGIPIVEGDDQRTLRQGSGCPATLGLSEGVADEPLLTKHPELELETFLGNRQPGAPRRTHRVKGDDERPTAISYLYPLRLQNINVLAIPPSRTPGNVCPTPECREGLTHAEPR